jgi:hypothetical protein
MLNIYLYNTRNRFLLKEDPHRANYGMNEPLNGAIRIFDEFSDLFEFGGRVSKEVSKNQGKNAPELVRLVLTLLV